MRRALLRRVAFIGVGRIGAPMAMRVARGGHEVRAVDVDWQCFEAELAHRKRGGGGDVDDGLLQRAESAASAVKGADVVCLCLPGPAEVERLIFGDDESLLDRLEPEQTVVDLTTSLPELSRRIHGACAERAVHTIDAPVSGGIEGARTGDLTMLVGADDESTVDRVRPVLDSMASHVGLCGGPGAGMSCKLLHNATCFASDMVLVEAMTTAAKAGIDTDAFHSVLKRSAYGKAFQLHVRLAETWLQGEFKTPRFQLQTAYKDVSLATALAAKHDVPVKMLDLCRLEMAQALERPGWAEQDMSVMHCLQEERAGAVPRLSPRAPGTVSLDSAPP